MVANCDHLQRLKFSPVLPRAFTEHGALMAAIVLNNSRAVAMSLYIVRAFVKMREQQAANAASDESHRRFHEQSRDWRQGACPRPRPGLP